MNSMYEALKNLNIDVPEKPKESCDQATKVLAHMIRVCPRADCGSFSMPT